MSRSSTAPRKLLAISDLHIRYTENRRIVSGLRPESDDDWLLLPGDVAETVEDFEWALSRLSRRFANILWAPGDHELCTIPGDTVGLRGAERYRHLVDVCRRLGIVCAEDPYPLWDGPEGTYAVAPLFLLYDYSLRPEGAASREQALTTARESGVVCIDEFFLHPDPYPSREAWCQARLATNAARLAASRATCRPYCPTISH